MHIKGEPTITSPNLNQSQTEPRSGSTRVKNITYAVLVAQGGCVTLLIVVGALFLGLFLDAQVGRRGPFTIGLLLLSIPFSLFVMLRLALGLIRQIQVQPKDARRDDLHKQEVDR